jgi:hypothetical protein
MTARFQKITANFHQMMTPSQKPLKTAKKLLFNPQETQNTIKQLSKNNTKIEKSTKTLYRPAKNLL